MSIYERKSRWKLYLAIAGAVIVLASMIYTNHLAGKLGEEERKRAEIWAMTMADFADFDEEDVGVCDNTLHLAIIKSNTNIPVIIVDERGDIYDAANFGNGLDSNHVYLKEQIVKLDAKGFEPIPIWDGTLLIYYQESKLLTQLRYFPVVQLCLIAAFVLFGYLGFNSARRAEQNRVWVGMAKETAHQLGTPISAIVAWIEHLRSIREDDEEVHEVLHELSNDVNRLELIAERFSKIGSLPKLDRVNIYEELYKCRLYMERRASKKVVFTFPGPDEDNLQVALNPPLFDWVIENLLRNALDAMGSKGEISAVVTKDNDYVYIDISDTGKGIPSGKYKTVFQPGYTTKKRGWGLGLSLAKRIIEQYHNGKIFVKKSQENVGTTFTIRLPKVGTAVAAKNPEKAAV
ncbi:MAG: HAMP domain-containing histidine kinase [Saprospiraceae bacterium]|nr:HAMP domain-containing histidine kinase [Saprospiraceae bacterium]